MRRLPESNHREGSERWYSKHQSCQSSYIQYCWRCTLRKECKNNMNFCSFAFGPLTTIPFFYCCSCCFNSILPSPKIYNQRSWQLLSAKWSLSGFVQRWIKLWPLSNHFQGSDKKRSRAVLTDRIRARNISQFNCALTDSQQVRILLSSNWLWRRRPECKMDHVIMPCARHFPDLSPGRVT